MAGALLAAAGREVILFDEKLAWEKPCGGGLTHKALQQYPFLIEAGSQGNPVVHCELISPSGQRVRFHMQHPVAIFSRRALNGLLLERARRAGVQVHQERITRIDRTGENWKLATRQREYRASYVMLAAGARNSFRAQFLSPISPSDLMVTAGYFIPGQTPLMQIQFLKGITGYIWVFPRADHVSAGIAGKMGEISTAELRRVLEKWLEENGFQMGYASVLFLTSMGSFEAASCFVSIEVGDIISFGDVFLTSWLTSISLVASDIAFLNSLIPLPTPLPSSGSLPGPKIIRAIAKIMIKCIG